MIGIKYKWRQDKRGIEIAMNMVVAIIVAVTVLGVVMYFILSVHPPPKVEISPQSLISDNATVITIIVSDAQDSHGLDGTVHLQGANVNTDLPKTSTTGKYEGSITAHLGQNINSGKIIVTVTITGYPEVTATINVYKP